MFSSQFTKESGQTLMELLVVISVSVVIMGALVFATVSSLRNAQFAKNQAQATKLAQEGIEKVRAARDRGDSIGGGLTLSNASIDSWKGEGLWNNRISGNCGDTTLSSPTFCYFKFGSGGLFQYLAAASSVPDSAEDPLDDGRFKRVVVLSDDSATYAAQKNVTVIVTWTDFSGPHESRLSTILRKL